MSDHPDPGPLPDLTAEQESAVRHLLEQVRHDEQIPDAVAARLDRVLAGLTPTEALADSVVSDPAVVGPSDAVDLAARRRRRNAVRVLTAAAAVVVGGFAVGHLISPESNESTADLSSQAPARVESASQGDGAADDAAGDTADDSAQSDSAQSDSAAPQADSAAPQAAVGPSSVPAAGPAAAAQDLRAQLGGALPIELDPTDLAGTVQGLIDTLPRAAIDTLRTTATRGRLINDQPGFGCGRADYGPGQLLPAYLQGMPVVLALRTGYANSLSAAGPVVLPAQLLQCGSAVDLGSFDVTLP